MSDLARILVAGLGSPHGDDQAGWIAINRLETKSLPGVEWARLVVPHDLLDRLDGIDELHLIDATESSDLQLANECIRLEAKHVGEKTSLYWHSSIGNSGDDVPVNPIRPTGLRSAGSHQLDILTVLDLANCLTRLPKCVVLWTIPGSRFGTVSEVSPECEQMINHCVAAIVSELRLAMY